MNRAAQSSVVSNYTVLMSKLAGCSNAAKVYAIQIYLLSEIRTLEANEIHEFIHVLHKLDSVSFSKLEHQLEHFKYDPEKITWRIQKKLSALSKILNLTNRSEEDIYQQLDSVIVKAKQFQEQIAAIAKLKNTETCTMDFALKQIEENEKQHLIATHATAELIANRILTSLNPHATENVLDSSIMTVGPLKKAAMFDVLNDKYMQVKSYHVEGKMMRDFKMLYKQELKKQKTG